MDTAAAEPHPVHVGPVVVGGTDFVVIAGPCAIESETQFDATARIAKNAGATMLRGGIYKLRTRPDSFQGLRGDALDIARRVRKQLGMPLVTEITDPRQIPDLIDAIDVFQVGSRNMYNYELLKELGLVPKPVLLKRAFSATIDEWLLAAEYVAQAGNRNIILCERGIRTFESATRNTLDLAAVTLAKRQSGYPVMVDPSHGTGRRELVIPMSLAAAAAGADGLLIEVHPDADRSLSDGFQAIDGATLTSLITQLEKILTAMGKNLAKPS